MPGLRRSTPDRGVIALIERLAEEYAGIPLPVVSRVVRDAAATVAGPDGRLEPKAGGVQAVLEVIEHVAREELDEMPADTERTPTARRASAPRASRATRRSGRHRGVASSS